MSADSQAQLAQLQEENANLKAQLGEPDLKAFEQIKELRSTNKRLTEEVKRLTGEGVQLAFKNRQLDQQLKKLQQEMAETLERASQEKQKLEAELSDALARGQRLDHSVEELQGELTQSRERVVSHEAELERQKDELARRQQNMSELQEELTTREGRIAKLEQLVHDFKEQFLSGDDFTAVPTSTAPGSAYEILMSHLDLALGIPGRTLVDQVYELMELPHASSDIQKLEELFDTLQDTGGQLFSEEQDQASLKSALAQAWEQVSGDAPPARPADPAPTPDLSSRLEADSELASTMGSLGLSLEDELSQTHEEPIAEEAVVEEPIAEEAVDEEPVAEEPIAEEPAVEEPVAEEPTAEEPVAEEPVAEEPIAEEPVAEEPVAEEPIAEEPALEELVVEAGADWSPAAAKAKFDQISEGLQLVSSQPDLAGEVLEQALEVETWVENEAKANLALARLKAGQEDIVPYLTEALPGVEMVYLFEILSSAESTATGNAPDRLALFYQFGSSPRAEVQKQELAIGMGKRGLNRDFVSHLGNEEEEEVVTFLRDNLLPKAGLKLPIPSEQFEQRLENTGPAAFVGTLRQALRAVDYTLFDFPELKVLTYDGDDLFLVDASAEPELTLIFHRDIEGMPPEELCFLVFRHLVRMYRGHSQLAHQSSALNDAQRLQLAQAAVELYLEEGSVPHPSLMDRLQALNHQAPEFEDECRTLLLHWYQATDWVGFLYAREFAFRDEVFLKRLDPVADHAAARLVGITAATYGCLREELLFQPELLEEVQEGLNDLFEHGTGITAARMRIQRMWNEFLLED
ncbi:MAG: hypothetical protein KF760_07385 [Candidatus Eremiobacteraeota bacterium]|nr:hypothetical protein [Candidatus Eremiobacteraeota bacterium]MCW5870830.1 hypothetical protein [Candidatus Eremiobacteraeota bacterium]